ncbi:hypothetical protein EST38_g8899 [Candolleomyces aberdarensis]|uniref:Short-chain dehydrogenase n=1 Tax=Candolleomyces aberdarensis TaxID=2316362 RepID=A0A4Q2DEL8_9AGAR|nr:hypothetical protein EST38_g8899 [Candolleomyces aberdarensis]
MKKTILSFIQDQRFKIPPVIQADLKGQTVIVVGANTGLGFETAKHFSRMGPAKLILACRNEEKGRAAVDKIREETGYSAELRALDLARFSSVLSFVDDFLKEGNRLDILVANAAITGTEYKTTADGWEETIVQVRYLESKLLIVFFARSLAELLKDTPVIVNCVNPGLCKSELRRSFSGIRSIMVNLLEKALARTAEEGSRQFVWAAVGGPDDVDLLRGAYINIYEVEEPSDDVLGEEGKRRQDKLWADLIEELSKVDGRVKEIVQDFSG